MHKKYTIKESFSFLKLRTITQNSKMCRTLDIVSNFGFKIANVFKNVSYFWHENCNEFKDNEIYEIKFMTSNLFDQESNKTTISGFNLYLAQYISIALNMTMNFINSGYVSNWVSNFKYCS